MSKPKGKRKPAPAVQDQIAPEMGQINPQGVNDLLPLWLEYVRGIGYDPVNHLAAIRRVRSEDDSSRYKRDVSKVVLSDSGEISFKWYGRKDTKEAAEEEQRIKPAEADARAIRDQYLAVKDKLPKHVSFTAAAAKDFADELAVKLEGEFRGSDGTKKREDYRQVALFCERGSSYAKSPGSVTFIQQRIRYDDGSKSDLPWTNWSDGERRRMEPRGEKLPLWGLERLDDGRPIMLHEGAFTAMQVRRRCDFYKGKCGYVDEAEEKLLAAAIEGNEALWEKLSDYTHLGWPAGGPNFRRADFSPLRQLDVTIACDRDKVGEKAAKGISRIIGTKVKAIIFDDHYKPGFDLADKWPDPPKLHWWAEDEETKRRRYVGPSLDNYIISVTKATRLVETTGKGRPAATVTPEFADEWYVTESMLFIPTDRPDVILNESRFNARVRQFSDVDNTARLMIAEGSSMVVDVTYEPGKGRIVADEDGSGMKVNTYRGSGIKPIKRSAAPFEEYMTYLIPGEKDRHALMRWCATLVARPEIKMYYGVLLHSTAQGIGKSTLGESILAPLVGRHNASAPNDYDIVEGRFNGWLDRKRLAVIHEIHTDGVRGKKVYDKLKSVLTEKRIEVEQKYMPKYSIPNRIHIFACTNFKTAINLVPEDRRWLVPGVTEEKGPREKWVKFFGWLRNDGLGAIAQWAADFVEKHGPVEEGEEPPMTSAKREVIEESMPEGMSLARDLARTMISKREEAKRKGEEAKIVVKVSDVRRFVADRRGLQIGSNFLEKEATLRKVMLSEGLHEKSKERMRAEKELTYVLANFPIDENSSWDLLKGHRKSPDEVMPM